MPADSATGGSPIQVDLELKGTPVPRHDGTGYALVDEEQAATLRQVCSAIIPAGAGLPSAGELGLASYVAAACAHSTRLSQALLLALRWIGHRYAEMPPALTDEQSWRACVSEFSVAHVDAFEMIKTLVYEGYYTHGSALSALQRRTGWQAGSVLTGSPMAPFDPASLARVRNLSASYRPVE